MSYIALQKKLKIKNTKIFSKNNKIKQNMNKLLLFTSMIIMSILLLLSYQYDIYIIIKKFDISYSNGEIILYDKQTLFQLFNEDVETQSLTVLTPQCVFDNSVFSCKKYLNIFLDANCTLHQTSKIKYDFLLYISPLYYNLYDSRFDANNIENLKWIFLPYSVVCQSNNVCLFVVNFVLSYKNWTQVPINGNSVTLDCNKFKIYSYV
jgi:hypothetical protein